MGFAVHWIRPKSKAPVLTDWAQRPVLSWEEIETTYKPGFNLGWRAGRWSTINGMGVICLDIDIRDEKLKEEAWEAAKKLIGDLAPTVRTGGGGAHVYLLIPLDKVPEVASIVLVKSETEISKGKPSWQIELLSTGKNVICPPSIHPTGKSYEFISKDFDRNLEVVPKAVLDQLEEIQQGRNNHSNLEWESPVFFDEVETPEISPHILPGMFGRFAEELSSSTETPSGLSVMCILGVISAIVSKKVFICPKEGWLEPLNIYTAVALPPGNNKSTIFNNCTDPLVSWEKRQAEVLEPILNVQRSERKTQEKIIESLRSRVAKEKDSKKQSDIIQEIIQKESALIEPAILPKLFANDATPESLAINVYEQGGRFAIFSDEGGITETLSGLYSRGNSNVDILLKGIDGGHLRVRRKDRNFDLNPFLTIVLTVQPQVIVNIANKRAYTGNGFLERFLYLVPRSKLGYRKHDNPPVSTWARISYVDRISALLDIFTSFLDSEDGAKILSLQSDALKVWKEFQLTTEVELRPQGKLASCQGWGGKISGFALRIAGILHVAEYGIEKTIVSLGTMQMAIELASLLKEHALAAYGLMGMDEATEDAKTVFQWIKDGNNLEITQTAFTYGMRHKRLGKAERLAKALCVLIDRNIISVPKKKPTRKPTIFYEVNPAVFLE